MTDFEKELEKARNHLLTEQEWFRDHGGTLEAYIARYGIPGSPHCYGDGGRAIFEADRLKLKIAEYRVKALLAESLDKILGKTK